MFILYFSFLFYITICFSLPTIDPHQTNSAPFEDVQNLDSSSSDVDSRIGLNFNQGHAQAYGPQGFSGSDSNTFGIQGGIQYPGNHYNPIFSQTGGQGSSYSSGLGAPNSWSNGDTQFGQGFTGGNVEAGFNGRQGIANTNSFTEQFQMPIDPFGGVLYHNLKDNNNKKDSRKQ